jgi:hypothetical protein
LLVDRAADVVGQKFAQHFVLQWPRPSCCGRCRRTSAQSSRKSIRRYFSCDSRQGKAQPLLSSTDAHLLMLFRVGQAGEHEVAQRRGRVWTAAGPAACEKTASAQSWRRTAVRASVDVAPASPDHRMAPARRSSGSEWYRAATAEYRPNQPRTAGAKGSCTSTASTTQRWP